MKYDCSQTLDFSHECRRMCDSMRACEECPLHTRCAEISDITAEHIDIVQKWSDSHPEPPKLTKREYEFLTTFAPCFKGRAIERTAKGLYIVFHCAFNDGSEGYSINPDMFPFISEGEEWCFDKLLGLEVEE